ncbi:GDP-L-galactose phosphorylase 1-like [Phragmites australis]|uniref:GDP-L-galactose phosphorylase 1-like n=1 Tax=Phragmites australis TaxID=29695 RepID=UPI002D78B542|nr:GDP-L-galactose phosphorylase 1-like [Phragmites australis]XP_062202279.1 GDP-L-galactose phosphorylase 1-like [Phragmites australis]XP_062202280.1 GDP-L-galactose phosphorylase 1-like [Phragmites australis]
MVSATKVEGEYSFLSKNSPLDQFEGVKTHLYRFGTEQHGNDNIRSFACADQGGPSLLDTIILSQWDGSAWKGHLDYDVTSCKLKVIEGGRNFVVQLNDKWNSFSLKGYDKFFELFGCLKPNCMKSYEGLLLCVAQGEKDRPEVVPSTSPPKDGLLLIANAYPVEYGHIFLVSSAINQLSCSWDKRMFGLATKIASEVNNAAFRVFFDNGTSVVPDRMFFQACYFANPLPVESASTVTIYDGKARSGIIVSEIVDYPLKALVFTSNNIKALVNVVSEISFSLHDNSTAYSLLISNNGTKVFVFPQVKNLVTGYSLSAWECGGYFVYHTKFDFDKASETEISNKMTSVSLQDGAFEDLKHLCCATVDDLVM